MLFPLLVVTALLPGPAHAVPHRVGLLQLQRTGGPSAFAGPAGGGDLNLKGFCQRVDGTNKPVCESQPCCCWSSFAADVHPAYPSEDETQSKRKCANPPRGYSYAAEPGLTFDDGFMDSLKKQALPVYDGRRLCCLRRSLGVQDDSQRDLRQAVPPTTTTPLPAAPVTTTLPLFVADAPPPMPAPAPAPVSEDPQPPAAFTTKAPDPVPLLNPGDEYENAQMEEAARAHMAAAKDLQGAVASLEASAVAIGEVNDKLQTDPNLVRSRKHVAEMKGAIRAWAERRWANLNRLKSGDASAFDNGPDGPPVPGGIEPMP